MKEAKNSSRNSEKKLPSGRTPQESDMRCCSLAASLAEKQLAEGTASSQVITHYLKLGSSRAELETERLRLENELLKAKTEALQAQKQTEEMFANAIKAFKTYAGGDEEDNEEDDYYG